MFAVLRSYLTSSPLLCLHPSRQAEALKADMTGRFAPSHVHLVAPAESDSSILTCFVSHMLADLVF